jgi:hypothetical protein
MKINDKILVLSMKLLVKGFTNITLNTLNIFFYNYINSSNGNIFTKTNHRKEVSLIKL